MIFTVSWVALAVVFAALGKLVDSSAIMGAGAVMAIMSCAFVGI